MKIFIKVALRDYARLRRHISTDSPAHEAINKATRIDHVLAGVQFEGYNIPCDADQARVILEIARQSCPAIIREIEEAMMLARPAKN